MKPSDSVDALVIGGGFYGCTIAHWLKQETAVRRVLIAEQENDLLTRSSWTNQARIHNGYHYPRSFVTAWRSRVNYDRFLREYSDCIDDEFEKLYCVARRNSHLSANQFLKFCGDIKAPCRAAPGRLLRLFDPEMIEAAFLVREAAFDAKLLRQRMWNELHDVGVEIKTDVKVLNVTATESGAEIDLVESGSPTSIRANRVYNCTYAGLRQFDLPRSNVDTGFKFEIAELALITPPDELENLGVTVVDGPFFSVMPFPAEGLHSLSHVRYTPHISWTATERPNENPYTVLDDYEKRSRAPFMIRDAARYMPCIGHCSYHHSIFEVKTLLQLSETNDSRPIMFERHRGTSGVYSVLGGKMDNIFDILETLQKEEPAYV